MKNIKIKCDFMPHCGNYKTLKCKTCKFNMRFELKDNFKNK